MQKKLLTAAVAGALAAPGAALAQVEVYGFLSVAVQNFRYSESTSGAPSVSKMDVSSHGSNYGIRGRETLGGGLTAWFQIEQNAPMQRSNNVAITPASRNTAVGFQGAWGNVFIGQWTTPWSDLESLWSIGAVGGYSPSLSIIGRRETSGTAPNPNCVNGHLSGGQAPGIGFTVVGGITSVSSAIICDNVESGGGVGHAFWRRFSDAVFYQSPVFGGVQIKFAYMSNEGKATAGPIVTSADPQAWSASVQWAGMGGRLRVGAAYDSHKDFTTPGETDWGWTVKGGWNFGFADVGLAYEFMQYKCGPGGTGCSGLTGDIEATQYGLAVAIPIGQGAIRASYALAEELEGPAGTLANTGAYTYTIGYDYRLSKRTQVGVGYAVIENDPGAIFTWTGAPPNQTGTGLAPLAGSDPSTLFISVIHRF